MTGRVRLGKVSRRRLPDPARAEAATRSREDAGRRDESRRDEGKHRDSARFRRGTKMHQH